MTKSNKNRSTSILSEDDKHALQKAYIEYHSPYNDGWTQLHYKQEIERIWSKYIKDVKRDWNDKQWLEY